MTDRLFDAFPDVLLALDERGIVVWSGGALQELLGYEPAALYGRAAITLVHASDEQRASYLGPMTNASLPERPHIVRLAPQHGASRPFELRVRRAATPLRLVVARPIGAGSSTPITESPAARDSGTLETVPAEGLHTVKNFLASIATFAELVLGELAEHDAHRADLLEIRHAALAALDVLKS